ncbi:MAG: DUF6483 family protein [Firmicutes bacterium]|nr:DUF6483 family protein [Bacillota bacterium]
MDVIEQMMRGAAEILAKILFNKTIPKEFYAQIAVMDLDELAFLLSALVTAGRLEQAEEILFTQFELNPSEELYDLGIEMYGQMSVYSDDELKNFDFSREEIDRGIADIEKLFKAVKA